MSSQRGNNSRSRPQKYQNKLAFNNLKYETSQKKMAIAKTDVVQVCEPCHNIIQWKIKFKKYKPLSQPKTCIKCHQKAVKHAYHTICAPCAQKLKVCSKCGKTKEVIKNAPPPLSVQMKEKAEIEAMVKKLPVRRRKTFYRYMDEMNGVVPMKPLSELETEEEIICQEARLKEQRSREMSHEDYMKVATAKIEELMKNCKLRHAFDDFDDDSLGDEEEFQDDDDDEDDDE